MKEVEVDSDIVKIAHEKAKKLGVVRRSITKGDGNFVGFIGEHLAQSVYGGELINTFKYDLVLPDGRRLDIKTKLTGYLPKPDYDCSVTDFQIDYDCDGYIFVRVLSDYQKGWVLGHISKKDFKDNSTYHKKGDKEGNFIFKHSCYNIKISQLEEL
jgi:hypothetical protein